MKRPNINVICTFLWAVPKGRQGEEGRDGKMEEEGNEGQEGMRKESQEKKYLELTSHPPVL